MECVINKTIMLQNYVKIAIRTLLKNKTFAIINALGLAIGMACCFLILLFLQHEFSYDQFHEKADNIYRINYGADFAGDGLVIAACPPPIAPLMHDNFPGIDQVARMYGRQVSVSTKDPNGNALNKYEIQNQFFADSTILNIFTFDFLQGNPTSALDAPSSIILTDEMAIQFFGTPDALGKVIYLEDTYPFTVTGVVRKFPENSHIQFNMIAPYPDMFNTAPEQSRTAMRNNLNSNWVISHSYTYVLLNEGGNPEEVDKAFPTLLEKFGNPQVREGQNFTLVPLKDIHLHSTAGSEPTPPANLSFLYIFLAIGFVTLLIAAINFVNFSTAGSLGRAKEVGVRKVLGASKSSVVTQFLGESMILSFIGFLISMILIRLALPYMNELTNRELSFDIINNGTLAALFLGIFILAGLLAGSYPAFFVTRFKPVSILRGKGFASIPKGVYLRKALITIQFIATIGLIGGALGIYKQIQYLQSQPMGFQSDYMLNVPLFSPQLNSIFGGLNGDLRQKINSFEEELLKNPKVEAITLSSTVPGQGAPRRNVQGEHITAEDNLYLTCNSVDYDFLETYELELVAGRSFDKEMGTDHQNAFVLNERAVADMQWKNAEDAIGKRLLREGKEGTVIGVVKDFHQTSLHQTIIPLVMDVQAAIFTNFSIKINSAEVPASLEFIEETWDEFFPQKVFEYTFLDESIENLYQAETRLGQIIGYFAFLAILISCFGLYGLVAFAAAQKTKEIGIRKVLGASIPSILTMLSKEFVFLILVAGFIALPLAYYGLTQWLTNYPYNISVGAWLFFIPILGVLTIALLTISYQTIKAAIANPVEALKYE
jgi:putative ABC transport system permease protein